MQKEDLIKLIDNGIELVSKEIELLAKEIELKKKDYEKIKMLQSRFPSSKLEFPKLVCEKNCLIYIKQELKMMCEYMSPRRFLPSYGHIVIDSLWNLEIGNDLLRILHAYEKIKE